MKIVYLMSGFGVGGAEQLVRDLSLKFAINGDLVTIISLMDNHYNIPINKNISFFSFNLKNNFFYFFLTLFKIYHLIIKINPDIIHTHMFHSNIIGRFFIIFLKKKPILICSAHSNNEGGFFRMFIYRISNFLSDEFFNVSENAVKAFERKQAVAKSKMSYIYNGINITNFPFSDHNIGEFKNSPVFLNVGSLTRLKDHVNLIKAFSLVVEQIPKSKLLIVGDGPLKKELINLVDELNISDSVSFLGIRSDISDLMKKSNVFVLSSSHEGFGIVLAEAMASGLIIVSTDCGGSREVLGDLGFIVPIKDYLELSKKMIETTFLNRDYKEHLILSGRNRVLDLFDINNIFSQWRNVYKLKLNEKN